MRFSVRVNNDLGYSELLTLAVAAEQAGFDQLWVSNDLFLRSAPVLMGALAAGTARIGLGIAVMNPYSVHVSELAMAAATLQEVSGGRFLLGLGAGAVPGLGRPRAGAAPGHHQGGAGQRAGAARPRGRGPRAAAGLRPQDFAAAARLAHDGHGAAQLIDDRMLSLGVAGDVADVLARCRVLARLGARHLSFGPPLGPDPVAALRLLGGQVLPALAQLTETEPTPLLRRLGGHRSCPHRFVCSFGCYRRRLATGSGWGRRHAGLTPQTRKSRPNMTTVRGSST